MLGVLHPCNIPTNHSLSSSLVERPGQRQSLSEMLMFQQVVYPLHKQRGGGAFTELQ